MIHCVNFNGIFKSQRDFSLLQASFPELGAYNWQLCRYHSNLAILFVPVAGTTDSFPTYCSLSLFFYVEHLSFYFFFSPSEARIRIRLKLHTETLFFFIGLQKLGALSKTWLACRAWVTIATRSGPVCRMRSKGKSGMGTLLLFNGSSVRTLGFWDSWSNKTRESCGGDKCCMA